MKTLVQILITFIKIIKNYFRELLQQEILVIGDSHSVVFSDQRMAIPRYQFNVISVPGATISGLRNPNSVTQALPIFEKAIQEYKGKICIILLGEVDTGFLIWHRSQKHGIGVNKIFEQTFSNYINFIKNISTDKSVIVIAAPLPTIKDNQDWGEIANARREVKATQLERTNLTLNLNQRLKKYSKELGFYFIDLDRESLGDDGCVKKNLLNKNSLDHHYDTEAYINILKPKIAKLLAQVGRKKLCR